MTTSLCKTPEMITAEGQRLAQHWSRYGRDQLDSYLIQDVEHPSINPQSVLIRAFVIDRLFPGEFAEMIEEELFFAACACHVLQANRQGRLRELFEAVRNTEADAALPEFLRRDFRLETGRLFDLEQLIAGLAKAITLGFEHFSSPFQDVWRQQFQGRSAAAPRIIELGCGSANDYRFWDSYGIAPQVDYVGIDVCEANISNARSRFPKIRFLTGDACCIDEQDRSFDVVLACDLLEHLSPAALDAALVEIERLARDEVWLSLFNASDAAAHIFQPVDDYHWNTLSLSETSRHLGAAGFSTEVVSIADVLEQRFSGYRHYNRAARILIGRRDVRCPPT